MLKDIKETKLFNQVQTVRHFQSSYKEQEYSIDNRNV